MRFFFLIFFLMTLSGYAQTVTVLDMETGQPVVNAALFNREKTTTAITGFNGQADISGFTNSETITITHLGYPDKKTTKAAIIAAGNFVYLQDEENQLNEVVLSVSKFQQESKEIAQKIVSLNSEDVIFFNPQTAADLLESSGQVYMQKSQLGGGSPMIRGFSTNRLLLTVDGVRMNTAIFRSGNLQNVINIDPFAIEKTEVILGPGSVIYGSDAMGGVMNFYTKKPSFSMEKDMQFSGNATARYSSANNEKTSHLDFNLGMEKWAFLSSVSYSDFDDLRMGSNGPDDYLREEYVIRQNSEDIVVPNPDPEVQVPTGFDLLNLMQKIRFMPDSTWDFDLGIHYSTTSDYSRYDRLTQKRRGQFRSAEWFYGPQRWFMTNLQVVKKGYNTIYDEVKINAAYQFFEESRNNRDFGSIFRYRTEEQVDAYSLGLDFTKKLRKNRFFYGFEYVFNHIGSSGIRSNIETGETAETASRYPDDSGWQSVAAYASGQFKLSEELNLQSGIRYNQVLINATFDDRFFDFPFERADVNTGNITGSLGLNWQRSEMLGLRLNLSTAFRAPNIDDIGKIFDSEPGSVVVPNPDLKAEYAYNSELGVALQFNDAVRIDLAVFYTHLQNALVRRDFSLDGQTMIDYQGEPSQVQAIQNAGTAEIYGFEAGAEVLFSKYFKLVSHFNLVKGSQEEDDGSQVPVRHAAPPFGDAHLIYVFKKWKLDAFAEFNGQFDFEDLAPSQAGNAYLYAKDENGNPYAPSWYTLNLTSQYQISDSWKATAAFENITDQRYRPYSSGISAPGRNLILSLTYNF